MRRLLSADNTKLVINDYQKKFKKECIISVPAVWITLCRTRALVYFRKSEPVRIWYEIVGGNKFIFNSYIHEVYTWA